MSLNNMGSLLRF